MKILGGLLFLNLLFCGRALADAGVVLVDGLVEHPLTLSAADLVSSPATELDNTTLTGHGSESAHYKGVALWWLVEHAGFVVEPGAKRADLRHYLLVTGRDGYQIVVSMGEIDPDFEAKPAIVSR